MSHTTTTRPLLAFALLAFTLLLFAAGADAQGTPDEPGQVRLPLTTYNQLVETGQTPKHVPRPVPAAYAIGTSQVTVTISSEGALATAEIAAELRIKTFENEWSSVPVLPAGTAVQQATVDGQPVQLVSSAYGLVWGIERAGAFQMSLRYRVDAQRFGDGTVLPIPLPEAAATTLTATIPGTGLDLSLVPAAGVKQVERGSATQVTAAIPTTSAVQLSWRTPTSLSHSLSRAHYTGSLAGDAVTWSGQLTVEVFSDRSVSLDLLPRAVTLRNVQVDGKESPILLNGDSFATLVKGSGVHQVTVAFQVPVSRDAGPPHIDLVIPQVPVSRLDLTLPGKKEVTVTPTANVTTRSSGGATVATVFIPMGSKVSLAWAEAVPEAVRAEVRANAAIYHTVHAEEGVLFVRAMVVYEVTRGATNLLKLQVPAGVQVNRIDAPSGAVADWRLTDEQGDRPREVTVFLDRKAEGELLLEVLYDRSLGVDDEPLVVPLLRALDVQRQRGMVALLSSTELTLKPIDENNAIRVGENQLPAFVRDAVSMTVAHTFKYVETPQGLTVEALPPERRQGRFDAQIDTLISLDDVSLRGSASVEINVKSGGIMELQLHLPEQVSLLSLSGPSIRTHTIEPANGRQQITVHFTQEMEGQFRLELGYEQIHEAGADDEVVVPTVAVADAEVAQGRLAVEARSAVEVQAAERDQLTTLDISELPQQLVLRTTNPILLSFKYVQAEPPPRLVLRVTHHQVVPVQEATIDEARYRTLFTPDGLAVTTADFVVRNSRKQFLRLHLPEGSTIWSTFVDGKAEKPALGEGDAAGTVLIKIITSTRGFPVQLIYGTKTSRISFFGKLRATLARPDILVTHSRWDVYLPEAMSYGPVDSNMDVVLEGVAESIQRRDAGAAAPGDGALAQVVEPLHLTVPVAGVHFAFEKWYANQGEEEAWFAVPYSSAGGAAIGRTLSLLCTLLLWAGVWLAWRTRQLTGQRTRRLWTLAAALAGAVLLLVIIIRFSIGAWPAATLTLLLAAGVAGCRFRRWRRPAAVQDRGSEPPHQAGDGDQNDGTDGGHDDRAEEAIGGEAEQGKEESADE